MKDVVRSHRETLTQPSKKIYDEIFKGLINRKKTIKIAEKNINTVISTFELVKEDNPLLFYVESCRVESYSNSLFSTIIPTYNTYIDYAESIKNQIENICNKVVSKIVNTDEWQVLLSLHDSICRTVSYRDNGGASHTIVGALLNKEAVCDGISKAFKCFCDCVGIECCLVYGVAKSSFGTLSYENHAWNKVRYKGHWFNVDVTHDLTMGCKDFIRHDYFMVDDQSISASHKESGKSFFPANTTGFDYFTLNNLVMNTQSDFSVYVLNQFNQGKKVLEIKLPEVRDITTIEDKLLNLVLKTFESLNTTMQVAVSANKDMLVFVVEIK